MEPRFINISEMWGEHLEFTIDDYKRQAVHFYVDPDTIEERDDGIYVGDEKVAINVPE